MTAGGDKRQWIAQGAHLVASGLISEKVRQVVGILKIIIDKEHGVMIAPGGKVDAVFIGQFRHQVIASAQGISTADRQ